MADKIIAASLQIDTGTSNENIKSVNKNLTDVNKSLDTAKGSAQGAGKAVETTSGSFGKLKDQMTAIPGPLGQAAGGVNTLSGAFKALLANPVVLVLTAIVATLALLYKAFTNTFAGGQKVEQIFAGIGAAGQSLLDNLDKIGSAIVKVFSFDFSGAIDDIKAVGQAAGEAFSAMADLTKQAQGLAKEQRSNDLEAAERAKKLAILREQATDEGISPAKRKAALKELQADAEQNAKDDVDLSKRVTENRIAQLTLQKDGALKNADEINKLKIEQINGETDNANELRRINKQVTAVEKQEQAERKAAQQAANEAAKAERQKLAEFNSKLTKLQTENELATISDAYAKELRALEIKITEERKVNQQAFDDKKITKAQQAQLNVELDNQLALQTAAINTKRNDELKKAEESFQKELSSIRTKTQLQGITDARQLERVTLQIGYEEKLADAIARYSSDAIKLQEIRNALAEQQRAEDDKLNEKFRLEDEKKKLAEMEVNAKNLLNNPAASLEAKQLIIDAEQAAFQAAFDNKLLTEKDYTDKMKELSNARVQIDEQEKAAKVATVGAIGNALGTLSELVGKQTVAGKAFAVAQATIATIQSAVSSFNSLSSIPIVGPALGAVAAAGAIASGIANVKKIIAVKVPGGSGGGGSVPNISTPAAPIAPTQISTRIDQSSINGIGDATKGGTRAYVLESDSSSGRERSERLSRAARLGG